jgi:hypothetical protein
MFHGTKYEAIAPVLQGEKHTKFAGLKSSESFPLFLEGLDRIAMPLAQPYATNANPVALSGAEPLAR